MRLDAGSSTFGSALASLTVAMMADKRALLAVLVFVSAGVFSGCGRLAVPTDRILMSGRIEGDTIDIAPKLAGRIFEITVREGDPVKAKDVLARMDSAQYSALRAEAAAKLTSGQDRLEQLRRQVPTIEERLKQAELVEGQAQLDAPARVAQAEAQRAVAEAELSRVTADLEQNRQDEARYKTLASKGAVPQQVADQASTRVKMATAAVRSARKQVAAAEAGVRVAKAQLENPRIRAAEKATLASQLNELKAQIKAAESDVVAAKATLDRTDADLADLEIRAPADGTVVTRAAEPGRVVSAGSTILTIVDLSKLYLRGFVPEGQIGLVKIGQPAAVMLDSAPKTEIPAEVMRIDPQSMFTPENTYFQEDRVKQVVGLKIRLKGGVGAAKLGMPADGFVRVSRDPGKAP